MMFLFHLTKGENGSLKIKSAVEYVDSFIWGNLPQ